MKDKKYMFFESYHRALSRVPDERYGRIVRAMSDYVFIGDLPKFTDDADWTVWELIRPILAHGKELSEIRAHAGRKGGSNGKGTTRNIGNKNAKTIANNSKTIADKKKEKKEDRRDIETSEETSHTLSLSPEEVKFGDFMNRFYPSVQELKEPLKLDQFERLCKDYGEDAVKDKLTAMENNKNLLKKYKSANLTLIGWLKRDRK